MKKSIIAMAVAGALAVPAIASADATLYGSLRVLADKTDNQKVNTSNVGSRLGVRGTVDLGLQETVGIYQVEMRFDPIGSGTGTVDGDNNVRRGGQSYIGATGGWGTAVAGVLDHPTENIDTVTDMTTFYDETLTDGYADSQITNTVAYVSPDMSGFKVTVGTVIAGGTKEDGDGSVGSEIRNARSNIDGYQIGAAFTGVENLKLQAAYGRISKDANLTVQNHNKWGVAAEYSLAAFDLAAKYTRVKYKEVDGDDSKERSYGFAGKYNINETLSAALMYTTTKLDDEKRAKATQFEVANKMGNGSVAAGYVDRNRAAGSDDTFYVGYRLNF